MGAWDRKARQCSNLTNLPKTAACCLSKQKIWQRRASSLTGTIGTLSSCHCDRAVREVLMLLPYSKQQSLQRVKHLLCGLNTFSSSSLLTFSECVNLILIASVQPIHAPSIWRSPTDFGVSGQNSLTLTKAFLSMALKAVLAQIPGRKLPTLFGLHAAARQNLDGHPLSRGLASRTASQP